ncbi:MAG: hypothetical protein ACRD8O_14730 [Bryobacteraceae bacterium]
MANEPVPREVIETEEYSAQFDDIIARHSLEVIGPVLTGVIEGIARTPRAFDRATRSIWMTKSNSLGLTIPTFTIFFSIEGNPESEGSPERERVLLLWIEENNPVDEITGH